MLSGRSGKPATWVTDGQTLQAAIQIFTYMGSTFPETPNIDVVINNRISKTNSACRQNEGESL